MLINKPSFYRRLEARLGLQPGYVAPRMDFNPVIILAQEIGELARETVIAAATVASAVSSIVTFYTVPAGKRWRVRASYFTRSGGDRTIDRVYVYSRKYGIGIPIESFTATAAHVSELYTSPVPLDEGDTVRIRFTSAGSSDGNWNSNLLYDEEDLY